MKTTRLKGCKRERVKSIKVNTEALGKGTLSSIVGSYKLVVTKNIRLLVPDFAWQPRFHASIILDPRSYMAITKYIENNPKKWRDPIR